MSPSTLAIPKGMLPLFSSQGGKLVVVPIVQLIVDALKAAGAQDICFVVGEKKDPLVTYLLASDQQAYFAHQPSPLGFADAVARAKEFVSDSPFFVHADDGLVLSGKRNLLSLMRAEVEGGTDAALLVRRVRGPFKGGVIIGKEAGGRIEVEEAFEKLPNPPSNLAITAVYAFSARSMSAISSVKPGRTGESELTDAISELAKEGRVVALVMDDDEVWLSVGNPEAYHSSLNVSYELAKTHLRDRGARKSKHQQRNDQAGQDQEGGRSQFCDPQMEMIRFQLARRVDSPQHL